MTMYSEQLTVRLTRRAAAQTVGITITRLVRYERMGLVSPTIVDRKAMYGAAELARLRKIRRLNEDLGVNLAGIEVILRLLDQMATPGVDPRL